MYITIIYQSIAYLSIYVCDYYLSPIICHLCVYLSSIHHLSIVYVTIYYLYIIYLCNYVTIIYQLPIY